MHCGICEIGLLFLHGGVQLFIPWSSLLGIISMLGTGGLYYG